MKFIRGRFTRSERKLASALEAGTVFGPESDDEADRPVIRAEIIRNMLRGVYQDLTPDPRGLRLRHVRVEGRLDLDYLETKLPLEMDRCDLPGGLTAVHARLSTLGLREMTVNRPSTEEPVINLADMHLRSLDLSGTTLVNNEGRALDGNGFRVEAGVTFSEGFTASGRDDEGAVWLVGASIDGQLIMSGAELTNDSGPALAADGLSTGGTVFLDKGFTATGRGDLGAVRFVGSRLGADLVLSGAKLTNDSGPALAADMLSAVSTVHLNEGFVAIGYGQYGVVRLHLATIGGQLLIGGVRLSEGHDSSADCAVLLLGTKVELGLWVSAEILQGEPRTGRWDVNGLTYGEIGVTTDQWLTFLRDGTEYYSPQPYQQLAAVLRAQGEERKTQKVLIAQHDHQLARSRTASWLLTGKQRAALQVLRLTVGYGYKTWFALLWLAGVVTLAMVAAFAFGSKDWMWVWGWLPDPNWTAAALQKPASLTAGTPEGPCLGVDLATIGLQTIPLVPLVSGAKDACVITDTAAGYTFLGVSVALKILAWALVTLFVAGYTNIVRKPGP